MATILFLLIVSFCLVAFPQVLEVKAEAKTIVVPDDYSTIQEAVRSAASGDTIYVKKGVYQENVGIDKPLSLIGEDVDSTIIESYSVPVKVISDRVNISGFTLSYGYAAIQMSEVKFCNIHANKITGATYGIRVFKSSSNNITENVFESIGSGSAIRLDYAPQNLIQRNYISSCVEGVQLMESSHNNTVTENTIVNCDDQGIRLLYCDNSMVIGNNITSCGIGLSIYGANNNTVYNNSFINNTVQISTNEWYAQQWGYTFSVNTINENYWSDYKGTDSNQDGLGDTPYVIDENNQDSSPLMNPVDVGVIAEFPSWTRILIMILATVSVAVIYKRRFYSQQKEETK